MPSTEWTAAVLLVAIYLLDCLVLLQRGQGLLERGWGRWYLRFGATYYTVRERPVALLSPYCPWRIALKTALPCSKKLVGHHGYRPSSVARAFSFPSLITALQAPLVLLLVPAFLIRNDPLALVVAVSIAYANAVLLVIVCLKRAARYDVSRGEIIKLVVPALLCIPLSVNLARRVTLLLLTELSAERAIRLLRGASSRLQASYALLGHVAELVEDADEQEPRRLELEKLGSRLREGFRHELG